jgi:hypothetical protein
VLHLKTVRFPQDSLWTYGLNMLGVNQYLDMERTFDYRASRSSSLNTHMQRDRIDIDLGYITSAGKDTFLSDIFIFNI